MTEQGGRVDRRTLLRDGSLALLSFVAGVAPFPAVSQISLAQTVGDRQNRELLDGERHAHTVDFRQVEQKQVQRYLQNADPEIIFKGDAIHSFYGILRSEVLALPGLHPTPDVYKQFTYRDKQGAYHTCCSGNDCRPAIIRMLGNRMIAVGVHYIENNRSVVLFFKISIDETNIVSTDSVQGDNPEYTKHKYHACVFDGKVYCAGFPAEW